MQLESGNKVLINFLYQLTFKVVPSSTGKSQIYSILLF